MDIWKLPDDSCAVLSRPHVADPRYMCCKRNNGDPNGPFKLTYGLDEKWHNLLWQEPNIKQKRDFASNILPAVKGTRPAVVSEDICRGTPQSLQMKRRNVLKVLKHKLAFCAKNDIPRTGLRPSPAVLDELFVLPPGTITLSLCYASGYEGVWRSGSNFLRILNVGIRWRSG